MAIYIYSHVSIYNIKYKYSQQDVYSIGILDIKIKNGHYWGYIDKKNISMRYKKNSTFKMKY